jgi:shikimate dehydrogenase
MPQVFAAVGVNAVWLPFEGGPAVLELMIEACAGGMRNLGGFTVTIPHKKTILPLLDRVSPRAQAAGAVNLVKRDTDGAVVGDIIDGRGFVRGLEATAIECAAPASGWSAWAASAARSRGAVRSRRRPPAGQRARRRAPDAPLRRSPAFHPDVPVANVDTPPKGIHYAVNATPLGLRPDDPLPFDPVVLSPDVLVAEVIMSPVETPLLQRARTRGRRIHPAATRSTIRCRSTSTGSASMPRASTWCVWCERFRETVLITGATDGVGRVVAKRLAGGRLARAGAWPQRGARGVAGQ